MKLAFFIYSLSSGGAERVTANLANYWSNKGWQITIITMDSVEKDFYRLDERIDRITLDLATDSRNLLSGVFANLRRILALRSVLKRTEPEVCVGMMTTANMLLAIGALGLPVIAIGSERIHPPMLPLGRIWSEGRRISYGLLSGMVVLTQRSRSWLLENTWTREVALIPNAVSWPLAGHEPVVPPQTHLALGRRTLLVVGRLESQKGFDLLIDSFSILAEQCPSWDLVIIGEGKERDGLKEQIQVNRLERRIKLLGRVGNVGDWYEAADLYVMSSRFEGFPNTLVEAMAHGLPTVSFDCDTGPRDIIRHKVDGLLVDNGDVDALSQTLRVLMKDQTLRNQLADRAVEVRERFSMKEITGMWEQLFESLFI